MSDEERAREMYDEALRGPTSDSIHQKIPRMFAAALAAERERCAEVCDKRGVEHAANQVGCDDHGRTVLATAGHEACLCAAAIRALGDEK